jgi:hypothetical protein
MYDHVSDCASDFSTCAYFFTGGQFRVMDLKQMCSIEGIDHRQ